MYCTASFAQEAPLPVQAPEKAPRVLSPAVARPLWIRILTDAGLPVEVEPVPEQSSALGFAERFVQQPPATIPYIPLAQSTEVFISETHKSARVGRLPWIPRCIPARDEDLQSFTTPLCPEACFQRMEEDRNSQCTPLHPIPTGVESTGPSRKTIPPFRVSAWNRARDEELPKLESLARDGLRVSNAQLMAFSQGVTCI